MRAVVVTALCAHGLLAAPGVAVAGGNAAARDGLLRTHRHSIRVRAFTQRRGSKVAVEPPLEPTDEHRADVNQIAGESEGEVVHVDEKLDSLKHENEQLKLKKKLLMKELKEQELEAENEKLAKETAELREAVVAQFGNSSAAAVEAEAAASDVVTMDEAAEAVAKDAEAPAEHALARKDVSRARKRHSRKTRGRTVVQKMEESTKEKWRQRVQKSEEWVRYYERNLTVRSRRFAEMAKVYRLAVEQQLRAKAIAEEAHEPAQPKARPVRNCTGAAKQSPSFLEKKTRMDPTCREGIISHEMTACCAADCGECDDDSDICRHKLTNGRASTCCPSDMLKDPMLPSCDFSLSPCEVPERIRAAPEVDNLKSAEGVRNSLQDCGQSIMEEDIRQLVHSHFIEFADKAIVSVEDGHPTKSHEGEFGTVQAAAAACNRISDCFGFVTTGSSSERADDAGVPSHLLVAGPRVEILEPSTTETTYLKVEDSSGNHFKFKPGLWGQCSKSCDGGTTIRALKCEGTAAGAEFKLGLCSAQVAMNDDALPPTTGACNVFNCTYEANFTDPIDFFITTDDMLADLQDVAAPSAIVDDVEDIMEEVVMEQPGVQINPSPNPGSKDFYYYYVCGNPVRSEDKSDWYLSVDQAARGPIRMEDTQNVQNPCTIGVQFDETYLVGEWGSNTELGIAYFDPKLPSWDLLERQYLDSGKAVHGPEDCFPMVAQSVAVVYTPLVWGLDQSECETILVPIAEQDNTPVGMCLYIVGAPLDLEIFRGDGTAQLLVDKSLITVVSEEEREEYGFSCSKGKMWAARNPFVYGFGWGVVAGYGVEAGIAGMDGYVGSLNGQYTGPFEAWWQDRLDLNGGEWPYPNWFESGESTDSYYY